MPEPRRMVAILLLGLSGGIVLAFLIARGELAGADVRAYWVGIRLWLNGADPFDPPEPFMPWAYAPWTLYLFLPLSLLPADMAWFLWRAVNIGGFAVTVAWAYDRRPLATALLLTVLAPALAANLDTGNINVFIVLGIWAAWFVGPRAGGLLWALGAGLKWLPAALILFIPRRARGWGLAWLSLLLIMTLATWPQTLLQIDVVFNFPRPLRLDYVLLVWAAVPWLWLQPWPPEWLRPSAILELARQIRRRPASWLRETLGLPAGSSDTRTHDAADHR